MSRQQANKSSCQSTKESNETFLPSRPTKLLKQNPRLCRNYLQKRRKVNDQSKSILACDLRLLIFQAVNPLFTWSSANDVTCFFGHRPKRF